MSNSSNPLPSTSRTTERLAQFVASCRWEDTSENVRHEAKRSLLNFFAVTLAGCNDPTLNIASHTYGRFTNRSDATVIGRSERTDILTATTLNAMSANVYDFDDTHIPTIIHPTAPVAPPILALSETTRITGSDFLLAFLLGVEVACRLGIAISPRHYTRGWHITSTCGVFGATMASGRLLHLNVPQLIWAIGIASSQASGLVECLGTMAKSIGIGNSARNGLISALLAQENFDGPAHALEGAKGFLYVFDDEPDISGIVDNLGSTWEIQKNTYKPYPCGVVLNPVVEACLALSDSIEGKHDLSQRIESVVLTGHPLLRQRTDRLNIQTGRESQVSAQHAVAVALTRGTAGLNDFSDDAVADPALRALRGLVHFQDDQNMSLDSAHVVVNFHEELPALEFSVDIARGALLRPLSDQDLETKLRELCRYGKSGCNQEKLIDSVWSLEKLDDVSTLLRITASHAHSRFA